MSVSKRLAVLRSHRALGAQSSTLPPAVRRPCTHGDIGRVLHQPWLSRARLMMPPQVAMLSVQRGRLSALSDVRRRLGQHSAGRTAAKLVVRARACFQRSEACWCISLAGWASERLRCGQRAGGAISCRCAGRLPRREGFWHKSCRADDLSIKCDPETLAANLVSPSAVASPKIQCCSCWAERARTMDHVMEFFGYHKDHKACRPHCIGRPSPEFVTAACVRAGAGGGGGGAAVPRQTEVRAGPEGDPSRASGCQ